MNSHIHASKQAPVNKLWSTENIVITLMKTHMKPTLQLQLLEGWIMLYAQHLRLGRMGFGMNGACRITTLISICWHFLVAEALPQYGAMIAVGKHAWYGLWKHQIYCHTRKNIFCRICTPESTIGTCASEYCSWVNYLSLHAICFRLCLCVHQSQGPWSGGCGFLWDGLTLYVLNFSEKT